MKDKGTVIQSEKGFQAIEMDGRDAGNCSGCGLGSICKQLQDGKRILTIAGEKKFSPGDRIEIEVSESSSIFMAFLVFIVPAGIITLSAVLFPFFIPQFWSIIAGFFLIIIYFIILHFLEKILLSKLKIKKIEPDSRF